MPHTKKVTPATTLKPEKTIEMSARVKYGGMSSPSSIISSPDLSQFINILREYIKVWGEKGRLSLFFDVPASQNS